MDLISQIKKDILDPSINLSLALRRAKALASELDNKELKAWVERETDGYEWKQGQSFEMFLATLPDYRVAEAELYADLFYRLQLFKGVSVRKMRELPDEATLFWFDDGVPTLEKYITKGDGYLTQPWPDALVKNLARLTPDKRIVRVWKQVPILFVHQILEATRERLLNFILQIEGTQLVYLGGESRQLSQQAYYEIHQHITVKDGGNMSTFDQRGQNVLGSQYNAAGNINFGDIKSIEVFAENLEKIDALLKEGIKTGLLEEDTATDAEYNLKKAIQQAKKPQLDKSSISSHLEKLKGILSGVTGMASTATLVAQAIEALKNL